MFGMIISAEQQRRGKSTFLSAAQIALRASVKAYQ
jgi:hypothetical protein